MRSFQIFSPILQVICLLCLQFSFAVQKLFSLIRSLLSIFVFVIAFDELVINFFPRLLFRMVFLRFSSRILIVLGLSFKSLIHLESMFVYGDRQWFNFILLHMASQLSQHHLLTRESFPHCTFLSSLSKIRWLYICGLISSSDSLLLQKYN